MARFDVYENPNAETRPHIPYLLDVQADLLEGLATRVVVPLVSASVMTSGTPHLNPRFNIKRESVVMSTAELAGVPAELLRERVYSLKEKREEISAALQFLFVGF
jgi:toxin CcdB